MAGAAFCFAHDPGFAEERSRIARERGRARGRGGRPSGSPAEASLSMLIGTRARQVKDDRPIIDRQRSMWAIRDAEMRQAWTERHRDQAERHRATLTDLIRDHETAAERLAGGGGRG
jgi:hypothetical protein